MIPRTPAEAQRGVEHAILPGSDFRMARAVVARIALDWIAEQRASSVRVLRRLADEAADADQPDTARCLMRAALAVALHTDVRRGAP